MKFISQLLLLNSLKAKITLVFLLLIIVIQATGYFTTSYNIQKNVRANSLHELKVGEHILNSLISQNVKSLTLAVKVLATDYGFREAISSNDIETIISALNNYQSRVAADIAFFNHNNGQFLASTTNPNSFATDHDINLLIKEAIQNGSASGMVVLNKVPYQLVVLPVKAPLTIGWVTMGFAIDDDLANKLHDLSELDVTFLSRNKGGNWTPTATTLNKVIADKLASFSQNLLLDKSISAETSVDNTLYSTRYVKLIQLNDRKDAEVIVALQRSLDEATLPYRTLQLNLLLIAIIGSLLFIMVGIYIAKRITKPLINFAKIAEKYEIGDYSTKVKVKGNDELAHLGGALNNMREAIESREKKISNLAYWDNLTGLPNRVAFAEMFNNYAKHIISEMRGITVILLDIDRFKQINLVLGRAGADEVLKLVAHRINEACYKKDLDFVARYGADKFAILLPSVGVDIASSVADRILKSLDAPAKINDQSVDLTARMGIATFPNHADNVESLLICAEVAMYEAKRLQVYSVIYDANLDSRNERNISFISDLKVAEEQNQFKFYVQPKLDLRTNKVVGVESLIRWLNNDQQLVYPDEFIPLAERVGHIAPISMWMLMGAANYYSEWVGYGVDVSIAVNLSARDLMDNELPDKVYRILMDKKVPTRALTLEITESSIMENPERAQMTVARLSNMGIKISIDDFGTGYSSFAYLKNLQVNELKIDKSFIQNMTAENEDIKIVRSTIDLAHNMGLKVVAEGIEDETVLDLLTQLGCDYGQGYYICRPMPVEKFNDWLIDWETKQL
ncbi:MAG: EAL domain-containing protein [Pseudomonadota bacterium]